MIQQLDFHTQQTIQTTSAQVLDPRPWKPLVYLSHINRRTNGDRFPLPPWETWL